MPAFMASVAAPLVYLNMPKAGCTSVKNWLFLLDHRIGMIDPMTIHSIEHAAFPHYDGDRDALLRAMPGRFVFTFVRHPLRRAYSTFCDKIVSRREEYFQPARDAMAQRYGLAIAQDADVEATRRAFRLFLLFARDTSDRTVDFRDDWHWAAQSTIVENARGVRLLDFIGRLEQPEDMDFVRAKAGPDAPPFPRFNEGPPSAHRYEDVIDDDIRDLGSQVYAADFRNFGYLP